MAVLMGSDRDWPLYRRLIVLLAALTLVAGCASQPKPAADTWSANDNQDIEEIDEENDPLELFNRFAFSFNLALDTFIFKPSAATYRFLLPVEVRDSVRNALRNLSTPVVLANDLLQGELERAETTLVRFLVNSTVGLLGLFDVAADWGYPYHDEDFGQTLAVHGVSEGFYLVLPIFGPSNPRDGIGMLVDTFLDPLTYVAHNNDAEEYLFARAAIAGIDLRSRNIEVLDDLKRDSIDFYARIRSLYRQSRANAISNGAVQDDLPTPGLYSFDFDADDEDKPEGESN
ncbi:MAG: VacJ family lipoprotein [Acidobacteriota bacterium]